MRLVFHLSLIAIVPSDLAAIHGAIAEAKLEKSKPTIICLKTTIGFGSKQQGSHGVHGSREFPI